MFFGDWGEDLEAILGLCLLLLGSYWDHLGGLSGATLAFFHNFGVLSRHSQPMLGHTPQSAPYGKPDIGAHPGGGGGHDPQTLVHICLVGLGSQLACG